MKEDKEDNKSEGTKEDESSKTQQVRFLSLMFTAVMAEDDDHGQRK